MRKIGMQIAKIPVKLVKIIYHIIYNFFCWLYPLPVKPTVVIVMDGGLCSQMFDYKLGELFKKSGFIVKYDMSWFESCGRCVLGKDARFYELNKIYPELKIKSASRICIAKFKDKCRNTEYNIEKSIANKRNVYLVNDKPLTFPHEKLDLIQEKLFSNPNPELDEVNRKIQEEIFHTEQSCAVHVRRGDLANAEIALKSGYGKIVTDVYYTSAVSLMNKLLSLM